MRGAVVAALMVALGVPAIAVADLEDKDFAYTREFRAPGDAPLLLEPDGPLFAHAQPAFADLRIEAADGREVPWRELPETEGAADEPIPLLNRGREGAFAVALLDLGPARRVVDTIRLDIPQQNFVGRVQVLGSDDRRTFTRLSTTAIYDIRGAKRARSTVAVFPPTDYRYLRLRARGIRTIAGATVSGTAEQERLERRDARLTTRQRQRVTRVTLDLGHRRVPVDELHLGARTRRYDRAVDVYGSNDRRAWAPLASARIFSFPGESGGIVPVAAEHRYVRVDIHNGDDPPLQGIEVEARAAPRTLLVAGRYPRPYRLLYGSRMLAPPEYDFAELPPASLGLRRARPGRLGAETRVEPPPQSFLDRHPNTLNAALAAAALVLGVGAFLAFRRRAAE